MATSVETALTGTWVEVVDNANDYVIQNNGSTPIFLFWKATAPATTDRGVQVMPGNGADSLTFLAGPVWARVTAAGVGSIVVNQ